MNDWYNDPPEDRPDCGPWSDPEPLYDTLKKKEQAYGEPVQPALCSHGNVWGECDHCDFESDIAFDAERERRMK